MLHIAVFLCIYLLLMQSEQINSASIPMTVPPRSKLPLEEWGCRLLKVPMLQAAWIRIHRSLKDFFWHLEENNFDFAGGIDRAREENSYWAGKQLLDLGYVDASLLCFQSALKKEKYRFAAYLEMGRVFKNNAHYSKAREFIARALAIHPDSADALLEFGLVSQSMGEFHVAQDAFRRCISTAPGAVLPLLYLARSLHGTAQFAEAWKVLREAEAGASGIKLPGILLEFARINRDFGNYTDALSYAEQAQNYAEDSSEDVQHALYLIRGDLKVYKAHYQPGVSLSKRDRVSPVRGRILHLLENSFPYKQSGYAVRTKYVLDAQRQMGLKPVAVTKPGVGEYEVIQQEVTQGQRYYRLPLKGSHNYNHYPLNGYLATYARTALRAAVKEGPEIIHATSNFKNAMAGSALATALGVPWVYEVRGLWEDTQVANGAITEQSERYQFFRMLENRVMEGADAVITISEALKDDLHQRGIDPEKIFVIPNGVDSEKFPPVERNRELAASTGINEAPTIGYISSFSHYEGIPVLIDGFAGVLQEYPEAKLILIGDGDDMGVIKSKIKQLEIEDSVLLPGRVTHTQIPKYYSLIDIFVVPRLASRVCEIVTPLKPYEAMAAGKVVVASDLRALNEIVEDGVTGFTFKAGDASALSSVISRLLDDRVTMKEVGQKAAAWVRKERDWSIVTRKYLEVYDYARKINQ